MYVLRWIKTLTLMKDRDRSGVFWGWGVWELVSNS